VLDVRLSYQASLAVSCHEVLIECLFSSHSYSYPCSSKQHRLSLSVHDGWGLSEAEKGNAILHGDTTHMDAIRDKHNFVELEAHGLAVGLNEGLMGNSEVG